MSLPLHAVFLDRVIRIEAVQRERAAVTDEDVADFFEFGRVPGDIGKYLWLLDGAPEPFPMGVVFADIDKDPMSPAMQRAWDAAVEAWRAFVAALRNGELLATATQPATGARRGLEPAEWIGDGLLLDVRAGELQRKKSGEVRWVAITLREAVEPREVTGPSESEVEASQPSQAEPLDLATALEPLDLATASREAVEPQPPKRTRKHGGGRKPAFEPDRIEALRNVCRDTLRENPKLITMTNDDLARHFRPLLDLKGDERTVSDRTLLRHIIGPVVGRRRTK